MSNHFEEIPRPTRDEMKAFVKADDAESLRKAVIGIAFYEKDYAFATDTCLQLAGHPDEFVRGNAILGFGHYARRFGRLNEGLVRPLIEAGITDESKYVRGQAWSAADDVQHYLGWKVAGHSDDEKT